MYCEFWKNAFRVSTISEKLLFCVPFIEFTHLFNTIAFVLPVIDFMSLLGSKVQ